MKKRFVLLVALLLLPVLVLSGCSMPNLSLGGAAIAPEVAPPAAAAPVAAPPAASAPTASSVLDALEGTLGQIYDQVNPSVVNIQVVVEQEGMSTVVPEIPGFPFGPSEPQGPPVQRGIGSGFVWDKEGHIVTNNHVVAEADKITVTFYDDTTVPGEVVGTDPHSDLAVVKVDLPADQLQPVQVADSIQVKVGQLAVAIGNPFGLEGTMTVGFVSALGRSLPVASGDMLGSSYTIPDIIQTDAPINPGNSGGVLVDDEGRVIGVPTAIESPVRANAGIGFAVPSAIVQKVVPALINDGSYEHPWLGISGTSLGFELAEAMGFEPDQRGVLVVDVVTGSPADEAGLRGSDRQVELEGQQVRIGGDVIVAIDGQSVKEFDDLITYLVRNKSVGETITLTIIHQGQEETVEVTLAARPKGEEQRGQREKDTTAGAWLGIQGLTVTPEIAEAMDLAPDQEGVLVEQVTQNSPADQAELRGSYKALDINGQRLQVGGDIITAMDDQPITQMEDLRAFLQQAQPGQKVTLTLLRDGEEVKVGVTLGERPTFIP
jgi:serine protease Do